jgi:hypothetical protein
VCLQQACAFALPETLCSKSDSSVRMLHPGFCERVSIDVTLHHIMPCVRDLAVDSSQHVRGESTLFYREYPLLLSFFAGR